MKTIRYVTLSVATTETPASQNAAALTHLVGCAMLIAERCANGGWSFDLRIATADNGEAGLLEWLAVRLPDHATVIGWQIGERLTPILIDAIDQAEAPLGYDLASRCALTFTTPCIDLASDMGGVGAPPLADVAGRAGFTIEALDQDQLFTAWAFSSLDGVRRQLEQEVIALWRLWLMRHFRHVEAIPATTEWLAGRD